MDSDESQNLICPRCQAVNSPGSAQCFLCDATILAPSTGRSNAQPSKPGIRAKIGAILLTASALMVLAVSTYVSPFGWLLVIPATCTTIAGFATSSLNRGPRRTLSGHIVSFASVVLITAFLAASSAIAFVATCTGIESINLGGPRGAGPNLQLGFKFGTFAAIVTPIPFLFHFYVRTKSRSRANGKGNPMERPSPEIVGCPSCGTRNFAIDDRCIQCGAMLEVVILPRPKVRHVGLASVMGVIAAVAICLAPVRFAPGLSILIAAFVVPATIRSVIILERRRLDSRKSSSGEMFAVILSSFFLCAAIVISGLFAFVITCFPVGLGAMGMSRNSSGGIIAALLAGAIAGIVTIYYVGKSLWPEKD